MSGKEKSRKKSDSSSSIRKGGKPRQLKKAPDKLDRENKALRSRIALLESKVQQLNITRSKIGATVNTFDDLTHEKKLTDAIVNSMPGIFYMLDFSGRFIRWNANFEHVSGYSGEEIAAINILDLFTGEDRQRIAAGMQKVAETGEATVEAEILHKSGHRTPYLFTGLRLEIEGMPSLIGMGIDISERKRAEKDLFELKEQLEQLVHKRTQELQAAQVELQNQRDEQRIIMDSVPACIFYKDMENRFIRVNQAFANFMGMAKESLEGKAMIDLYPKEQADAYWDDDKKVMDSGQPRRNIIESLVTSEKTRWVQTDKIPYRDVNGDIIGIIGFTIDITELELKVEQRTAQLELSNKELEAFSYSVSHDLRAPLRHINGYVDLLNERFREQLPEKARHYLATVTDAAKQMGMLIDDLLQFSRTGRQEMRLTDLDMNVVLKEVLGEFQPDMTGRSIQWKIATLPCVNGDRLLLRLVWENLLSNALKFTRVQTKVRIEIGFQENIGEYVFFVRDNGAGFDMRYAHKLFGVFQRLHSTDEFEGTGIGLANVQRIILRHGGRTWAEAEIDKGATIYFALPKKREEKT